MSATTTRPAAALDLDLVIGERPGATCPGCGRWIPATRQPVIELETPDGRVVCHHCSRQTDPGLYHAAALLSHVLAERLAGRTDHARSLLLAVADGMELIDEYEAEQAARTGAAP